MTARARTTALDGRVALVTGGSRGIGRAIALGLAYSGADVAVNYRTRGEQATAFVREVEALGRRAIAVGADVSFEQEVGRLFADVIPGEASAPHLGEERAGHRRRRLELGQPGDHPLAGLQRSP